MSTCPGLRQFEEKRRDVVRITPLHFQQLKMHLNEQDYESVLNKANRLVQMDIHIKWQSYMWDTLYKSSQERKYSVKPDFTLLTFA